jgi:hypothetical protein
MVLKSLVSIHKRATDNVSWHNVEKNIYDETVDASYTVRFLGVPIFCTGKDLLTRHTFENDKTVKSSTGFKTNGSK